MHAQGAAPGAADAARLRRSYSIFARQIKGVAGPRCLAWQESAIHIGRPQRCEGSAIYLGRNQTASPIDVAVIHSMKKPTGPQERQWPKPVVLRPP